LLRRQGLYSSNLTTWRRQREQGMLTGLSPKKRGRKNKPKNPLAEQVARLEKENRKLRLKLKQAETIIDVQKKVSQMLGISQDLNNEKD
jgi:transposase